MIDLKLGKLTHDIVIENHDLVLVKDATGDPQQIEQNLKERLLFFKGEWFLDTEHGIPYFTDIMKKNPNIPDVEAILKAEILDVSGVNEITKFKIDFNVSLRKLTVNFIVNTDYGLLPISETL